MTYAEGMESQQNRREFMKSSLAASLAFAGLDTCLASSEEPASKLISPYGPLIPDPKGVLDLPEGFEYTIISKAGSAMSDGLKVPALPDGMAAFPGKDGNIILVRNHELSINQQLLGPYRDRKSMDEALKHHFYDAEKGSKRNPYLGGTTNVVYNPTTKKVEKEFLSLIGTDRNCAGGAMPWGAWITCEEPVNLTKKYGRAHGYCFEVKATDDGLLQEPIPLKALGRFCHEAVELDPRTGILYLTEDVGDGLLYRFIPKVKEDLSAGKLQALALVEQASADTRNFRGARQRMETKKAYQVKWIDLEDIDSPNNDLRIRGYRNGAAIFARGEGIIYSDGDIYICCTIGGPGYQGQIFKLTPASDAEGTDSLELFLQPSHTDLLTNCDNICSSDWGDLIICEDLANPNASHGVFIRGVTPKGEIYTLARNAINNREFAGSCFSPDGSILFVNMQASGYTLAITGDWKRG